MAPRSPTPPGLPVEPEDLEQPREPRPQRVAASREGMVATAHYRATEAGVRALEAGGNAVDSAVAAAFALGVCEPAASGLGGQTMALIYLAAEGRTVALDGSSRAPNRVIPGTLTRAEQLVGYRAATVPSTPAALDYLVRRYGRLDLRTVLQPAIELAEAGYSVTKLQSALTKRELAYLRAGTAAQFFLKGGVRAYPAGSVFRQPVLARTLRRLADAGIEDFYTGRIAAAIAADMRAHGGLIHEDDLARIPWPIERESVEGPFEGRRVATFPPPGAGRTLIQMLNMLAGFTDGDLIPDSPEGALLLAATIRRAFTDREDSPVDPNFYAQMQDECAMLSEEYGEQQARRIRRALRRSLREAGRGETTHLSVMDAEGNAVALTQSIERVYGCFSATPELGFLYNNYMSAFEHEDISHPYYLRPNGVPWASVAPTIVFEGEEPWLVIGSPGSERITPSIFQVLLRLEEQSPFEAVDAPRLFCSTDGVVSLEAARMRTDIPEALERHGFTVRVRDPYSFYMGCVQLVLREDGRLIGVADPRRDGSAAGPKAGPAGVLSEGL
ncbi:MAG: gamma-glutamyltransferase [Thermoleophilia bacterium]